jgi:hypothetical protein
MNIVEVSDLPSLKCSSHWSLRLYPASHCGKLGLFLTDVPSCSAGLVGVESGLNSIRVIVHSIADSTKVLGVAECFIAVGGCFIPVPFVGCMRGRAGEWEWG